MAKKEKKKKGEEAEAEKPEAAAEGAEGEAPAKKKMAGKTLVLFIILPALLVLGGGGAAAMMLLGGGKKAEAAEAAEGHDEHGEAATDAHGEKKPDKKKKDEKNKKDDHGKAAGGHGEAAEGEGGDVGSLTVGHDGDPSYYTMPKIIVNLASNDGDRPQLLELSLVLEASDPEQFEKVVPMMPRLKDTFQSFLRELRVEDLDGSAGSFRLRAELLKRFNLVMAPDKIDAVLIEGLLVQ
jgi:flagellar FliL protein